MAGVPQCVASCGVRSSVSVMTRSTSASVILRGAPGRGSSNNPSSRLQWLANEPMQRRSRHWSCSTLTPARGARCARLCTAVGRLAQLKTQCQIDYVPCRRLVGNQIVLLARVTAHNLGRELQMATRPAERVTTPTRMALWGFQELQTLRHTFLARAGRLTRPQGELTLTISANAEVQREILEHLEAASAA